MGWLNSKTSPIGVDIGGHLIKAVQLTGSGGNWQLRSTVSTPLPAADAPIAQHLRDILFRHGFAGREIVLSAPIKQLEMEVLELPPRSSGAPIEQIARMELARSARMEDQPFELECWDLPSPTRGSNQTSVMAVAMRHADADALLDPFDAEGFNIIAIDAQCCALARACAPLQSPDSITAILDLGCSGAMIALVRDGLVIYQRWFCDVGTGMLIRAVIDEFQLTAEEAEFALHDNQLAEDAATHKMGEMTGRHADALVENIQSAFHYAAHRHPDTPIAQLLLAGGGSGIVGMTEQLAGRLNLKVAALSPTRVVECPPHLIPRCGDGLFAAAMGLAMHGAK